MKLAVLPAARADLLRGARVARVVGSRGVAVPEIHCACRALDRVAVTVVIEKRLGTSDAFSVWPMLGPAGRGALVAPVTAALRVLHAFREGDLDLPIKARDGDDPAKEALGPLLLGLLDGPVACDRVPADLRKALKARVEAGISALPSPLDRRLCHGTLSPQAMCLDRRAFAGLRDFEAARWGDPWEDITCWLVSSCDLGTPAATEIVRTYLAGEAPPPRLAERMDLYFGADIIRGISWAPPDAPTHVVERFTEALGAWAHAERALG